MTEQNTGAREAKQGEAVDDRGTNQQEGRALLKSLRDNGFDSSDEQLAVALGRPIESDPMLAQWPISRYAGPVPGPVPRRL